MGGSVSGKRPCTSGPVSSYVTNPRRTSSMAMTVGFLDDVGSTGRAPPCS
jgi:hypothetical protein